MTIGKEYLMSPPVVIARCQIEIDLEKKQPPMVHCQIDRERIANPKLQEGMVCETELKVFEWDGKLIHRWETLCRPEERVFRRLQPGLNPRVIEELKQKLKHRQSKPQPAPQSQPQPRPQPKTITYTAKDVIST